MIKINESETITEDEFSKLQQEVRNTYKDIFSIQEYNLKDKNLPVTLCEFKMMFPFVNIGSWVFEEIPKETYIEIIQSIAEIFTQKLGWINFNKKTEDVTN